jgi:polysaccharide pyruvyl transferase WcaK-like protein
MMQVAVARLAALWPDASIGVRTEAPERLSAICPEAIPLVVSGGRLGRTGDAIGEGVLARFSTAAKSSISDTKAYVRQRYPALILGVNRLSRKRRHPAACMEGLSDADAMVICGMGGATDAFPEYALGLLERIELALDAGLPVVMVSQGIGPLRERELRRRAAAVLPRIAFISLREGRTGRRILEELGVPPERIMTTGDDAIETAYRSRPERLGHALGVNLRAARYASVDHELVAEFGQVLRDAARSYRAAMISLPISTVPGEEDENTIEALLSGYDHVLEDGIVVTSPLQVIERAKTCRVVVTGSYHAAVFALSMGASVVGIARSEYYADKFLGLAEQFQIGCDVVFAHGSGWHGEARAALNRAWQSAEQVRPHLLAAAERQVVLGHAAYRRLRDVIMQDAESAAGSGLR